MADTIAITAGSGTTVSTDQVTIAGVAQHAQMVKVLSAVDGSTNRLIVNSDGTIPIVGNVAAAATDSGNPLKIGGVAITANLATLFTHGQRANVLTDKTGRLIVVTNHARALAAHQQTSLNTTAETTIVTAGASGVFNDLTALTVTNRGATAANATIRDSTAGTARMVLRCANISNQLIPIGSVPWPQTTAAQAWTIQMSAKSTVEVTAIFVKNV